jgi:hypothetical protein
LDEKAIWESSLVQRYALDPNRDREFLDDLWEKQILPGFMAELEVAEDVSNFQGQLVETAAPLCEAYLRGQHSNSNAGAGGRPRGPGSEADLSSRLSFDPKSKSHVIALSEYLTRVAAVERRVMGFRKRYLGGTTKTVTPAEMPQLLQSWSVAPGEESEDDVTLYWTREERPVRFRGSYGSAIGELDRLGSYLARNYPWFQDQAMHFVLCGEVTQVKTLSGKPRQSMNLGPAAHAFHRGTITLEIEAWMPPELVKKGYAKIQRELRENMARQGVNMPRSGGRGTEVFRFVVGRSEVEVVSEAEHLGKLVLRETWRELRRLWDANLPPGHAWHYGEEGARNFYRDFVNGQKAVTGSKWGLLAIPRQPMTAAEAKAGVDRMIENFARHAKEHGNQPFKEIT